MKTGWQHADGVYSALFPSQRRQEYGYDDQEKLCRKQGVFRYGQHADGVYSALFPRGIRLNMRVCVMEIDPGFAGFSA